MRFTESHEWVKWHGEIATVGISDYAQRELGDVVYVELPLVGHEVRAGQDAVVIESTKSAVDIYTPLSGKIVEVNEALRGSPEMINQSPQDKGWLFKLKPLSSEEYEKLMDSEDYNRYITK